MLTQVGIRSFEPMIEIVKTGKAGIGIAYGMSPFEFMAAVLHDWDDANAVRILTACRQAMATDGRVLIVERLIPDEPADAMPALLSDINMLVVTGGRERTTAEYGRLLAEAGLTLGKVEPVAPPYGILEGLA